jgi:hypothetical protein
MFIMHPRNSIKPMQLAKYQHELILCDSAIIHLLYFVLKKHEKREGYIYIGCSVGYIIIREPQLEERRGNTMYILLPEFDL